MAFWSCEPELSICSFLIYATQTLTPSDKGQALLLVWCPKMTAQGKVCPWRNSRNLCSEPPWATRQLDSAQRSCSEVFKCINKKIRARAPYAGEKKIPSYLGDKFRKMLNFFFFSLIVKNRKAAGLHRILSCWIIRERKHKFIHKADNWPLLLHTTRDVTIKWCACFFLNRNSKVILQEKFQSNLTLRKSEEFTISSEKGKIWTSHW